MEVSLILGKLLLYLLAHRRHRHFLLACKNPQEIQRKLLAEILKNCRSPFPEGVTTYRDYEASLDSLTSENVLFFETTSGSTGNKKRIPYTRSFLKDFNELFLVWAYDLVFCSGLELSKGRIFISISPQIGDDTHDDRDYLSPLVKFILSPFLVSLPGSHRAKSGEEFMEKMAHDLAEAKDLEIISVWSPTYFISLLQAIRKARPDFDVKVAWPGLKLISCWTEGQAAPSARKLKELFPHVQIQGKGLLATEAAISLPISSASGCVPYLTGTYLEFMDKDKKILPLHQLQVGQSYLILTSTRNGFLRYKTGDEVLVTHFFEKTPVLSFLGRQERSLDLAGEKLSEAILVELFSEITFPYLFLPSFADGLPFYEVLIDASAADDKMYVESQYWEDKLCRIHHYQLARSLGQLGDLKLRILPDLMNRYFSFLQERGMVLGEIKESLLMTDLELASAFREKLLP